MSYLAFVSRSTGAFNVYSGPYSSNVIGYIYPGECYSENGAAEGGTRLPIYFRNASGTPCQGYVSYTMKKDFFNLWKVSNGTLVSNTKNSDGYYVHTIKSGYNMNWYIGTTKQANPLPGGTKLYFKGDAIGVGNNYPYRLMFNGYKIPGGSFVQVDFWIDFLTLGSFVSNRVIL